MLKTAVLAGLAMIAFGCSTTDERDAQRCAQMGAVTQDQMFQCRMNIRNNRAAASSALMQSGGALLSTPPQPRPSQTMCRRVGQTVVCNTI